ncbi:PCP degradation transcriptional activation protein [Zhongshania aliphaticivorans]|uniref:PCP degradation transcriptional activation protein n=1 Tax=Zhongshania aliphaticivorans TaxID=1470434 RepID=A0A5S9MT24_9GAMM|nr:LysR family transcriptional regulator [Zhongshania aliphaticivorans]CAA0079405.1 PCP degradation transcriptional activation protein [Zhongshania aliphaticivorans]CAA0086212.1 PCP degradation transcriptional activation protein [Zhongshania aliphaticivorans]
MANNNMDLNLFKVFDAVYRANSLTEAAKALHITQPAVSNALARLREHFDDPLFVRRGRSIAPTPLADSIAAEISNSLTTLQESLHRGQEFDPTTSKRRFVISMGDPMEFVALPSLLAQLQKSAPGIRLQSQRLVRDQLSRQLISGELSMAIDIPQAVDPSIEQQFLFRDDLWVMMRKNHPLAEHSLSLKNYLNAHHVSVSGRSRGSVIEDAALNRKGLNRNITLRGQSYYSASHIVAESDLLLTLPRHLALRFQDFLPLHILPLPMKLPALEVQLYWHRSANNDTAHQWLRAQIHQIIAQNNREE